MAQDVYKRGAVKACDGAVAMKREDGSGPMSWAVMTIENGGHYGSFDEVADWEDK
ncbi:hypothetical protein [Mycobacteroides abscessus]|uniref:hypothetical protein n=1 Tax=Mycobacteroides abscessus TaxID=36809 RepID=UPI0009C8F135|nr:hypothetical protein [Mycobacteroides abscessus]SKI64643.1 Uncharacterised protein [Mycobacteroides abscessus subsp. abscessus]